MPAGDTEGPFTRVIRERSGDAVADGLHARRQWREDVRCAFQQAVGLVVAPEIYWPGSSFSRQKFRELRRASKEFHNRLGKAQSRTEMYAVVVDGLVHFALAARAEGVLDIENEWKRMADRMTHLADTEPPQC